MQQSAEGGRPPGVVPAGPHSTETPDDILVSQSEFQTPQSAAGYPRRHRSRLVGLCGCRRLPEAVRPSAAAHPSSVANIVQSDYPNHHPPPAAAAATSAAAPQGSYLTGAAAGPQWGAPLPGVAFSGAAAAPGQTPRGAAAQETPRLPAAATGNFLPSVITQVSSEEEVAAQAAAAASHANGSVAYPPPNFLLPQEIRPLLGPQTGRDRGKKTLVLDLDETLVHSAFRPVPCYAFKISVGIDGHEQDIFVSKRPGVDEFLLRASHWFELVVFTASLDKYANPVMDLLDPDRVCSYRLFRESCTPVIFANVGQGPNYVKDLSRLGRNLGHVIIIDNSPIAYHFHPYNAIPIRSWFGDQSDRELSELAELLSDLAQVDDVPETMKNIQQGKLDTPSPNEAAAVR